MASLILALPPRVEDGLLRAVVDSGHDVLARVTGAQEVIDAVRAATADPLHLVLAASATTLDRDVLAELDARGARAVAVACSESDRRNAQALGHHEVVDEGASWEEIEVLLLMVRPGGPAAPSGILRADPAAAARAHGTEDPRAGSEQTGDRRRIPGGRRSRGATHTSAAAGTPLSADPQAGEGADPSASLRVAGSGARRTRWWRAGRVGVRRPSVPAAVGPRSGTARRDEAPGRPAGDALPGRIIAVWGPQGAPGRTTTALAVAGEIAAAGHSTALVDADVHGGTVATVLGLLDEAPGFAAACRLAAAESLTLQELDRVAQHHPSTRAPGFSVLTGISRPDRWPELTEGRVSAVLQTCRTWREYTVVDASFNLEDDEEISSDLFAPRRNAATHAVLRSADQVIAVVSADTVGLSRFFRSYVQLLEIVDPSRVVVLVNRVRASAGGFDAAGQVRRTLFRFGSIDAVGFVPEDRAALDAAVLAGATLRDTAPRSPALVEWSRFTRAALLPQADASRRVRRQAASRRRVLGGRTDRAGEADPRPA